MKKRFLKVYQSYINNKQTPEIKLKGQWLQELGFIIGMNLSVECLENQIIIKSENYINDEDDNKNMTN